MTWTPATPPSAAWAKDTTTTSTWGADAPPFAAWDVESTTSTRRITQDGRLRVTEQNVIRIIERRFTPTWNRDPPPSGIWTNEA